MFILCVAFERILEWPCMVMDLLSMHSDGLLNVMGALNDGNLNDLTEKIFFKQSLVSFAYMMGICQNYCFECHVELAQCLLKYILPIYNLVFMQ